MKIVICGSMSASLQMVTAEKELLENNHEVVLPKNTKEYAKGVFQTETSHESTQNKIDHDLIRSYFKAIDGCDAVLVVNPDKKGIRNYIGGNSFLEMGFAHCLNKKIYILHGMPDMLYSDEIAAMMPVLLSGDLSSILD